MTDDANQERKIIIDEDWKSKVETEREDLKNQPDQEEFPELPPASFSFLITSLATQALAALGQFPDPVENKHIVHLELAKHHIDLLTMLEEKTKGNLTDEESKTLTDILHQIRMLFVSMQKAAENAPAGGIDLSQMNDK